MTALTLVLRSLTQVSYNLPYDIAVVICLLNLVMLNIDYMPFR